MRSRESCPSAISAPFVHELRPCSLLTDDRIPIARMGKAHWQSRIGKFYATSPGGHRGANASIGCVRCTSYGTIPPLCFRVTSQCSSLYTLPLTKHI